MNKLSIFIVLVSMILIASCDSNSKSNGLDKDVVNKEIADLRLEIERSGINSVSEKAPFKIVKLYVEYAEAFPKDTLSKGYLFECAQVNLGLGLVPEAIANLDTIVERYPNDDLAPSALNFKAFILDDRMRRWQKAAEVLDVLMEKYPDSEAAKNAPAYKATLGRSLDDVIKDMELKNKAAKE